MENKKIFPDFIYNRLDFWDKKAELLSFGNGRYAYVLAKDKMATLGLWLTNISLEDVKKLSNAVFSKHRNVNKIFIENSLVPIGKVRKKNHFRILLPTTAEELSMRLSKKGRYNIQRQKRLIEQEYGTVSITEYNTENVPDEVFKRYFELKKVTHHVDYSMSKEEYIERYHVSNIYVMYADKNIIAIVLSCEQCPVVYIENLTYDTQLSRYSPGQVLYDDYLKRLIEKGKKEIFLAGGNLDYKKRYGSMEETVYDCIVYRHKVKQYYDMLMENIKKPIKKLLRRN